MGPTRVTRRTVLGGLAASVAGASVSGSGTAEARRADAPRSAGHIVGTAPDPDAVERVRARASAVKRELDFGDVGCAVAGTFPAAKLRRLAAKEYVRYVEADGRMRAIDGRAGEPPGSGDGRLGRRADLPPVGRGGGRRSSGASAAGETLPWGVDRIDAEVARGAGATGAGAHVAVLDTGIDSDHPDLQSNLPQNRAAHFAASGAACRGTGSQCRYPWDDDNGHGTHVAGTAAAADDGAGYVGVAPEVRLHSVKVLDNTGSGTWSGIAEGITWVGDRGYDVANMSLGGSQRSLAVEDACRYAYERGVLLVAAAGNAGPCERCVEYPARHRTVIAVGATNKHNFLANFSATGPQVELAAPGTNVPSTYVGGQYAIGSGTSMASPHVAGVGALLLADPDAANATNVRFNLRGGLVNDAYRDPGGVRGRLRETADDRGPAGQDRRYGYGIVDAAESVTGVETPLASG